MNRSQEPLEWNIPPSAQSLEVLYVAIIKQLKDLKNKVKEYMRRYKSFWGDGLLQSDLLHPYPLINTYDLFLELEKEIAAKERQEAFNAQMRQTVGTSIVRGKPRVGKKRVCRGKNYEVYLY